MADLDDDGDRAVTLFGRDISQIPCFRKTFLYSISGGLGTGLVYFLFTSKVRLSSHVGFASFFGITFSYWFYCRYQWSKNRFLIGQIQKGMQQYAMYEGTEVEKRMKEKLQGSSEA